MPTEPMIGRAEAHLKPAFMSHRQLRIGPAQTIHSWPPVSLSAQVNTWFDDHVNCDSIGAASIFVDAEHRAEPTLKYSAQPGFRSTVPSSGTGSGWASPRRP